MNFKKLIILCGLAATGLLSMAAAALADPMRVTQNSDLHAGPGTHTLVVGTVASGATVDRQQCPGNGQWCYVTRDVGPAGWIQANRLAPPAPPPGTGTGAGQPAYANAQVNVRPGPGTSYTPPIGRLERHDVVRRHQCVPGNPSGTWCYVTRDAGVDGWVSASFLTAGTPPVAPPPPAAGETVVALANVNLRSSAGGGDNIIGQVPRGTVLTRLQCSASGEWCQVRLPNGNTGWVSAAYLSASVPDEPPPPPPPAAGDLYRARVLLNVRQQPAGNVIGVLQPGQVVVRNQCSVVAGDQWCFIRTESGNTGWVNASFIEPVGSAPPAPPAPPPPAPPAGQICFEGPLGSICLSN